MIEVITARTVTVTARAARGSDSPFLEQNGMFVDLAGTQHARRRD